MVCDHAERRSQACQYQNQTKPNHGMIFHAGALKTQLSSKSPWTSTPSPILKKKHVYSPPSGPSAIMVSHSSHSICTKMRRWDTHQGASAESILNETGISKYSLYWSENTTLSFFFFLRKHIPLWSDPDSQNTSYQPWGSVAQSGGF